MTKFRQTECGPGSIARFDSIYVLSLFVLFSVPRGLPTGSPVFLSHQNQHRLETVIVLPKVVFSTEKTWTGVVWTLNKIPIIIR